MSDKKRLTREDVANIEVGKTEISNSVKWFLVLIFLGLIFGVPLIQSVIEVNQDVQADQTASFLPRAFSAFNFVEQKREISKIKTSEDTLSTAFDVTQTVNAKTMADIKEFEDALEEQSWFRQAVSPGVKSFLIGVLRSGTEDVYCGEDNWLFFRPSIDYLTGRGFLDPSVLKIRRLSGDETQAPPQPDPVKAIVEFRDQLAERGIELVVLPAPPKPSIYPEKFSKRYHGNMSPLYNPSYNEFAQSLNDAGVRLFDPSQLLFDAKSTDELFLTTDTHWSPRGPELVAHDLADYLIKENLLPKPVKTKYVQNASRVTNLGDIATMLKLPEDQTLYSPQEVEIKSVYDLDMRPYKSSRDSEILLLGDSYTNIYSLDGMGWGEGAGLVEQLGFNLQQPVDAIVINDKGSFSTRQQLSREQQKGHDRLAGKKVVVYEFAMRELAIGDWKTGLDLTVGKVDLDAAASENVEITGTVTGIIEQISKVPKPGSVPYKDCIVALHLKLSDRVQGENADKDAVVFLWGMKNNKLQPAAYYQPGQKITLDLVPWESVEGRLGSYNRIELDNDNLLWLDIYWAGDKGDETDESVQKSVESKSAPVEAVSPKLATTPAPAEKTVQSKRDMNSLFIADLKKQVELLEAANKNTLKAKDGWLFFGPELRSLSVGPFWGENAQKVSRATNSKYADPFPAIVDFNNQLQAAGIELLLVPVPAKAVIYPEMLSEDIAANDGEPLPRFDENIQEFFDLLSKEGVKIVDLVPDFLAHRDDSEGGVYCKQDSHWSPRACELTAHKIAEQVKGQSWLDTVPKKEYENETRQLEITGDLWKFLGDETLTKEELPLQQVGVREGETLTPISPWRESPVLLLGDSHTLVFQAGKDLHAKGGGLADHLAKELGFPVDLVGVRGSGATPSRMNLLRRRDNLAGKKLVIWCFTVREFTESLSGWRVLPVIQEAK